MIASLIRSTAKVTLIWIIMFLVTEIFNVPIFSAVVARDVKYGVVGTTTMLIAIICLVKEHKPLGRPNSQPDSIKTWCRALLGLRLCCILLLNRLQNAWSMFGSSAGLEKSIDVLHQYLFGDVFVQAVQKLIQLILFREASKLLRTTCEGSNIAKNFDYVFFEHLACLSLDFRSTLDE